MAFSQISAEHWQHVHNLRVPEVVRDMLLRPERLYPPQRFTPSEPVFYAVEAIPKEKNQFTSIEEALEKVRYWCGDD